MDRPVDRPVGRPVGRPRDKARAWAAGAVDGAVKGADPVVGVCAPNVASAKRMSKAGRAISRPAPNAEQT